MNLIFLQSYEFWWLVMWSAVGVSWSSLVVTILPLWVLGGNTFVRRRTCVALVGLVFVMNTGVQILLPAVQYSGVKLPSIVPVLLSFLTQIVPMVVGPWVMRGQLRSSMRDACRMQSVIVLVELFVAIMVAGVVAPVFSRASPTVQVGIRLIVFPIFVELLVMMSRCSGIRYLKAHVPQDVMLGYISQSVMITSIVGRFLTTNMNTTAQTVLVSVATATVEVAMRLTMVHRDGFYQSVCSSRALRFFRRVGAKCGCCSSAEATAAAGDDEDSDSDTTDMQTIGFGPVQKSQQAPSTVYQGSVSAAHAASMAAEGMQGAQQGAAHAHGVGTSWQVPSKKGEHTTSTELHEGGMIDDTTPGGEVGVMQAHRTASSAAAAAAAGPGPEPKGRALSSTADAHPDSGTSGSRTYSNISASNPSSHGHSVSTTASSSPRALVFSSGVQAAAVASKQATEAAPPTAPAAQWEEDPDASGHDGPAQSLLPTPAISIHVPENRMRPDFAQSQPAAQQDVMQLLTPTHMARLRRVGDNAVNTQSYYAFLIADTMAEDIGILASLSLSLLFRVPARRGELPISADQVLIRVMIQYLLEALTDIGPALTYYVSSMLCGVRLSPVTSRMVAASVGLPPQVSKKVPSRRSLSPAATFRRTGGGSTPKQAGEYPAMPQGLARATPLGLATPGGNDLGAIAELSELGDESDDGSGSSDGSILSLSGASMAHQFSQMHSTSRMTFASTSVHEMTSVESSSPTAGSRGTGPGRWARAQASLEPHDSHAHDRDHGSDAPMALVAHSHNAADCKRISSSSASPACGFEQSPQPDAVSRSHSPGDGQHMHVLTAPSTSDHALSEPIPAAGAGTQLRPAPPLPSRRSLCCCPALLLREEDADVQAASAVAHDAFALRRRGIASDPIWQPVNMRQLLHMAVFGRAETRDQNQAPSPSASAGGGGTGIPINALDAHLAAGTNIHASSTGDGKLMLKSVSQISDASERDLVLAKPKRSVLFQQVHAESLSQLSSLQYAAVWLSLRTELLAVRLSRAWETRVPGWTVLYVFSTLHALNLTTRLLTGVGLRCPYVDPAGDWYWNFCTPAE